MHQLGIRVWSTRKFCCYGNPEPGEKCYWGADGVL